MKNWIMMTLALMAFSLLPSPGTELGELRPVSVLAVETEDKQIRLSTDTMDVGVGETLDGALQNLEATSSGHLFLDTVENLVITERSRFLLPQLKKLLRPGVTVCVAASEMDMETIPEFLHTHVPSHHLADTDESTPLQKLTCSEERYLLEK
ncbi:MAG: hypothetical protein SOX71_02570 [Candidatus Faecousia sp.]|nr:hypothetical protein [Candidatus Faecousia sp.]